MPMPPPRGLTMAAIQIGMDMEGWSLNLPAETVNPQATNRPYSQRTKPPTTGTGSKVGPTKSK